MSDENPTQKNRHIAITTSLGEDKLLLRKISGVEPISGLFKYTAYLLSTDGEVKADDIVGTAVGVRINFPEGERYLHGLVRRFSQVVHVGDYFEYIAEIVPWMWVLTQTTDCRIWQAKNVPDIIGEIFSDHGFSDVETRLTTSNYQPREYCVQYHETAFAFVSRLMEQEGIYYYWKHEEGKHTLVLCDTASKHDDCPEYASIPFRDGEKNRAVHLDREGYNQEQIIDWQVDYQITSGKYSVADYNFTTPKNKLVFAVEAKKEHTHAGMPLFDYPGEFPDKAEGERLVKVRMEEAAVAHHVVRAKTVARGICTGHTFTLEDFWREDQNAKHLIISTHICALVGDYDNIDRESEDENGEFFCEFEAIPATVQYRAPRRTPKPHIHGSQTAVVTGPSAEEIYVDEHGRIKVLFHWDRYSEPDENSSCWIRVSHPWAGKGWGMMAIPRIGQEVVVNFMSGDPDQPIVVGRVYNADQTPPYALPDNKTRTVWQSRSSKEGASDNFNELRFEDLKDSEEIYFHAEKDFNRVVENNDTLKVGFEKQDPGDQTIDIYNDRTVTIDQGNDTLTVKTGNRTITVDTGDDKTQIKSGKQTILVDSGDQETTIGSGNMTVKVSAGECTIEAATAITLKVGGSSIKIEPAKITVKAATVEVTGDGKVDVGSPLTTVKGDGSLTLQGGMVKIN